jgi:hypothetical protein
MFFLIGVLVLDLLVQSDDRFPFTKGFGDPCCTESGKIAPRARGAEPAGDAVLGVRPGTC